MPHLRPALVFAVLATLLLFELNASRFAFMPGDVDPDAVTLRLKETPMRGGVVVLPANGRGEPPAYAPCRRHKKPIIVGTSGFNSPYEDQIEADTRAGPIPARLMQLFEDAPASYVVIENHLIPPERRIDYETFLARAIVAGRLRYINRFDGRSDLYAVVKTEPQAKAEAPLPFGHETKDWAAHIKENPVNLLGQFRSWSQSVYRLHVAVYGSMPRFSDFLRDMEAVGAGVVASSLDGQQPKLEENLRQLAERVNSQDRFKTMTNERFVDAIAGQCPPRSHAGRARRLYRQAKQRRSHARAGVAGHREQSPVCQKENETAPSFCSTTSVTCIATRTMRQTETWTVSISGSKKWKRPGKLTGSRVRLWRRLNTKRRRRGEAARPTWSS